MTRIRVLVVEDSPTVRKHLVGVLSSSPALEIVGEASDGREAIDLCLLHRPDVVTLDMMLPVLTGLSATEYIMAYCPTPILIVSGSTNRGEAFKTYEALAAGAVDVLEKPRCDQFDGSWERRLIETVQIVSRVRVITHPRARLRPAARGPLPIATGMRASSETFCCVAIGASTGGPQALGRILRELPASFPLPILIVLHISPGFDASFADWLNDLCPLTVTTGQDGDVLPAYGAGRVMLAPAGRHLLLADGRLRLTRDPEVHSCRPSIDVLFESAARELGHRAIAVLLTGMGRDGARGLLAVRQAGGTTIAQDRETSVIFGMPREAIQLGAADRVVALDEVAPTLVALARGETKGGCADETTRAHRRRQPHGSQGP